MGDLPVFVSIVGLMVAVGVAVGMIVASRLDRIMTHPRPAAPSPAAEAVPADPSATDAEAEPTAKEPHP